MPDEHLCGITTITAGPNGALAHRCGLTEGHHRKQHVCFVCGHPWTS